jgi:hypothetical protein
MAGKGATHPSTAAAATATATAALVTITAFGRVHLPLCGVGVNIPYLEPDICYSPESTRHF